MALAVLRYKGIRGTRQHFIADIGTNSFYLFKIGSAKKNSNGLVMIDEVTYQSPLIRLQRPSRIQTDFLLEISVQLFNNQSRYFQLFSFKNKEKVGPAFSELIQVNTTMAGELPDFFPNLALSATKFNEMKINTVGNKKFCYQEPVVSQAMFWDNVLKAIPKLLEVATPVVKDLLNNSDKKSSTNGATQGSESNAILEAIQKMIGEITKKEVPSTSSPTTREEKKSEAASYPYHSESLAISPAMLTSLIPVIEKVLSPETINAIGDQPVKLFKAIGDSFLKMNQQEMEHLERLNPGVDDPTILPLLNSMSIPTTSKPNIRFKLHPKINLDFVETETVRLNGKSRIVYRKGAAVRIPIKVYTNAASAPKRPIPKAIAHLIIQDSETMKVLLEKKIQLKSVKLGDTIYDIILDDFELQMLPVNKDLKVEVSFIWKGKKTKQLNGIFKNHYISLINQFTFDAMGAQQGVPVLLNDYLNHRSFWHKVWEGGYSSSKRWEIDFDMKYYYALSLEEEKASRLSTKVKVTKDNAEKGEEPPHKRRVEAKIKSGMELNLEILNQILPSLGQPKLDQEKLDAIKSAEFQRFFNQQARVSLEMRGKAGDTGTLWVYPEITIHQLKLSKIAEINNYGMVTRMEPEMILFPHPSAIHFIGTKSK